MIVATGPATSQPGRHFTWAELTRSEVASKRGWDNTPGVAAQQALAALVHEVLDPLRDLLGVPMRVSSGYRSAAVNLAAGSKSTSQHLAGEAVDFRADGIASEEVVRRLAATDLPFDQAIWYCTERGGHVHVSHTMTRTNRRELRHAPAGGGYPTWTP